MAELQITGGTVLIDDEDLPLVTGYRWRIHKRIGSAFAYNGRSVLFMHRLILDTPGSACLEHKNGNKLDNRRQNLARMKGAKPTRVCGLFGVEAQNNKFRARMRCNGKDIFLGSYRTAREAAETYDAAALLYFGPSVVTNKSAGRIKPEHGIDNSGHRIGASGFKGVKRHAKSADIWLAYIWADGESIYLGSFGSKPEAARAYDKAAMEHLGPLAVTNASLGLLPENSLDTAS